MTEVRKITPRSVLGYVLLSISIIVLAIVAVNAFLLATGVNQPLVINTSTDETYQMALGLATQIGAYALLATTAGILMANSVKLITNDK
jgi:hypothetical protein